MKYVFTHAKKAHLLKNCITCLVFYVYERVFGQNPLLRAIGVTTGFVEVGLLFMNSNYSLVT